MTEPQMDQQALLKLRPFFQQYVGRFVKNFFKNLEVVRGQKSASIPNALSYAAGYIFYRHFYPGMQLKRLPDISGEEEKGYHTLLTEREALERTIMEMRRDVESHLNEEMNRQKGELQQFLERGLGDVAALTGQKAPKVTPASPEDLAITAAVARHAKEAARESIADTLLKIKKKNSGLLCFNLYQDVPISYDAAILQIMPQRNMVVLRVHRYQATVIAEDRFTYLKHAMLPGAIKASLVSLQRSKNEATFDRLEYSTVGMDSRGQVRVRPKESDPLLADMTTVTGAKIMGDIQDISMGGMGVLVPEGEYRSGTPLEIAITPRNMQTLLLHGTVMVVKPANKKKKILLGLKFQSGTDADVFISQYIYQRQAEVVRELQNKSVPE
ncbi:MAG: PilZ domain-containing protein [Magnetococcales bacterium]|nr:PilZ domain-containing protein [Magnetococcales bacterium]MBF0322934.1 PilZ domain-containing protein [Magnetococcales bacterium]